MLAAESSHESSRMTASHTYGVAPKAYLGCLGRSPPLRQIAATRFSGLAFKCSESFLLPPIMHTGLGLHRIDIRMIDDGTVFVVKTLLVEGDRILAVAGGRARPGQ